MQCENHRNAKKITKMVVVVVVSIFACPPSPKPPPAKPKKPKQSSRNLSCKNNCNAKIIAMQIFFAKMVVVVVVVVSNFACPPSPKPLPAKPKKPKQSPRNLSCKNNCKAKISAMQK